MPLISGIEEQHHKGLEHIAVLVCAIAKKKAPAALRYCSSVLGAAGFVYIPFAVYGKVHLPSTKRRRATTARAGRETYRKKGMKGQPDTE